MENNDDPIMHLAEYLTAAEHNTLKNDIAWENPPCTLEFIQRPKNCTVVVKVTDLDGKPSKNCIAVCDMGAVNPDTGDRVKTSTVYSMDVYRELSADDLLKRIDEIVDNKFVCTAVPRENRFMWSTLSFIISNKELPEYSLLDRIHGFLKMSCENGKYTDDWSKAFKWLNSQSHLI